MWEDNQLFCGDNLGIMKSLPKECIDLIYIDPPFFSGRNFFSKDREYAFKDKWKDMEAYLFWLNERLIEMKRLLKSTGSIFVHLDHHICHYIKIELDRIFGFDNFKNEIIWHYTGGGRSKNYFSRKHDNIFWYSKSKKFIFNIDEVRFPYKETSGYAKKGIIGSNGKRYKPNPLGTPIDDVWNIPIINPLSYERVGYPTQKPEELLSRIIRATTREGDIVGDFFMGGGTTLVVAEKLGRKWMGCDISKSSLSLSKERLLRLKNQDL